MMIDAKRKLRVMLDGEILRLPAPLAFESHPQSLRVIRPSGEGGSDRSRHHASRNARSPEAIVFRNSQVTRVRVLVGNLAI
ncbi:MAG: hypothetical protein ACI9R3_005942 [Verrucomicrobiales bacterium]